MSTPPSKAKPAPKIDEVARAKKRRARAKRLSASSVLAKLNLELQTEPRTTVKRGDRSERRTFTAVGRAMTAWTRVEIALTQLFITLTRVDNRYVSIPARAFGAVRSTEGKLEVLRAAAVPFFVIENMRCTTNGEQSLINFLATHRKQFSDICNSVKKKSSSRNEIAHGIVGPLYQKPRRSLSYVVMPAPMDPKSTIVQVPTYTHGSKEIDAFSDSYEALARETRELNVKLRHLVDLLDELVEVA